MKLVKYLVIAILCLIIFVAIYLATLDGKYEISRSRLIEAKPTVVFNDLNDYKNWKDWGPWHEKDSTIEISYAEKTKGRGASYTWTSEIEGNGEMRTLDVKSPETIHQELVFHTPFGNMKSEIFWILKELESGTELTWQISGTLPFMMRFMAAGMEEQLGPMQERGLELFKNNIEEKIKVYQIESKGVVDYSGGFYLYKTTSSRIDEISQNFQRIENELKVYTEAHELRVSGSPFVLYHKMDLENGTAMFSVGYPIPERVLTEKGSQVLVGFINRGQYLKTVLTGDHSNSENAWLKAEQDVEKLKDYSSQDSGEPFEIYVNSLENTPNPADLVTEIFIPVEPKISETNFFDTAVD